MNADPSPPPVEPPDYPVRLGVETPERVANWRPLVQWLLAIPHMFLATVITYAAQIVAVIGWFVILFTGRLPVGMANFFALSLRYSMRVSGYAGFLHDSYPPFDYTMTGIDPGEHPVRVDINPALENRNRLTVAFRFIWVIPAAIVAMVIGLIAVLCWFVAFFAVLFTGRWPDSLRNWVLRGLRASLRVNAYLFLLTDEYPPLNFD